jgi:hypothetical protein
MNIAEIALLAVALIAIIRASLNYIKIDDLTGIKLEGFTNKSRKSGIKNKGKNRMEDITVLESEKMDDYFDTDNIDEELSTTTQPLTLSSETNKISNDAVNQVNSILGISKFQDIPTTTNNNSNCNLNSNTNSNGIESTFLPQIQIGKGSQDTLTNMFNLFKMGGVNSISPAGTGSTGSSASNAATWATAFSDDGMSFKNTMKPKSNLWSSDLDNDWTQGLNDFNNGRWNPKLYKNPSDYTDFYTPSAYGMSSDRSRKSIGKPAMDTTPTSVKRASFKNVPNNTESNNDVPTATTLDSYGQPKKLCGEYDDLSMDQSGNLVIKNYTQAKKWVPGYTYVPPVYWDVPQRHTSVCKTSGPNVQKLTGLVDRGLPINALELNPNGELANTEDTVSLTNVGSIMPKFTYQETPYSSPYI